MDSASLLIILYNLNLKFAWVLGPGNHWLIYPWSVAFSRISFHVFMVMKIVNMKSTFGKVLSTQYTLLIV